MIKTAILPLLPKKHLRLLSLLSEKHSFVIVSENIDIDKIHEDLIVVPTQQEAFDIIEMEEMERDLGF